MLRKIISKKKTHPLKEIIYIDDNNNYINSNLENQEKKEFVFFNNLSNLYENAKSIAQIRKKIEENNSVIKKLDKKINTFFNVDELINNRLIDLFLSISLIASIFIFSITHTFSLFQTKIEQKHGSYQEYNLKLLNEHLKFQLITQEPIDYIQYLEGKHYENSTSLSSKEKEEESIHNIIQVEKAQLIKDNGYMFILIIYSIFTYFILYFCVLNRVINISKWREQLFLEIEKEVKNKDAIALVQNEYQLNFLKINPCTDKIHLQDAVNNFYLETSPHLSASQFYILNSFITKRMPPFIFDYQANAFVFNEQSNIMDDYQLFKKDIKFLNNQS